VEEAFMRAGAGWLEHFFYNEYYAKEEDTFLLADAIRTNTKPSST
jgi:hypothetical protein